MRATRRLVLPGYENSGAEHWQTLWEKNDPSLQRVQQRDWLRPDCDEWVHALDAAVAGDEVFLVAHSLGCLLVAHWAARGGRARGALLVAPPDPTRPDFPESITGFRPLPEAPLPFPSLLVASSDDPYCALDRAMALGRQWGSRVVEVGPRGHLNGASGLGDWPAGLALLRELENSPLP